MRLVFDYFCERTPRSFVESRESSVVWNYKYADVEFGRLQVRNWGACGSAVLAVGCGLAWLSSSVIAAASFGCAGHTLVCPAHQV